VKTLARIAKIGLAAAIVCALTGVYAETMPRRHPYGQEKDRTIRPSAPDLSRLPNAMGQIVLVGLIAVGGRVILRLRLG
jgi:hypothetical protein